MSRPHDQRQRHFILTEGRSGSNFLVNALNQHPQVINYGEILGHWSLPYRLYQILSRFGLSWQEYLDWLYTSDRAIYLANIYSSTRKLLNRQPPNRKPVTNIKTVGIKDFSFLIDKHALTDYFCTRNIHIIYLYRKNLLKRYISLVRMKKTGQVMARDNVTPVKLRIDTDQLLKQLNIFQEERFLSENIVSKLDTDKIYSVTYEDLFSSKDSTNKHLNAIFEFLNVQPIDVEYKHKKLGLNDLKQYIENYSSVEKTLLGTPFEQYLYY